MKLTLTAATVLLAVSSATAQTSAPPTYGNCSQSAKYTPVQFVFPNATIYESFCPNSFCRSLVANALNFRPTDGDCIVRRTNFTALLYSQIIDPFAKSCEIAPAPVTSKPPVTSAPPPTTTAPPPTTTRPACA